MASNLDKLTDEQINGPLRGKNKLTEEDLQGPVTGLPDSLAAKEVPKSPVDIGGGPIINRFLGIAAPSDPQQPEGWQPSSAPKVEPTYLYEQPTLTSGRLEESFIDKAVHGVAKFLGFDPDQLSEQAKADALIQVMAKQAGLPLHEYRKSPEAIEQLTKGIVSGFTGGLAPAFMESATGEKPLPTTSTSGYVAERLGSLSGFLAGPVQIAKAIPSIGKVLSGTKATQSMPLLRRMVTDAVHQSILLGTAATISELGEAGKSLTFSDAVKKLGWAGISGSITGATFGIARGMFPADGIQQGARLITGLLGLNAQRVAETGKNPWTDRPLGEVVFDTALDAFFLWSGLPKSKVDRITNDLNSVVEKKTEIAQKEQIVQQIPEQEIRLTQEKIIESEKQQAEQNAKAAAEEIKKDVEEAQQTIETAKKIRKVKEKKVRTPEEQAALNERMAALRARRGKTGEAKVAKPAVQVPTLQVEPSVPGILAAPTLEKPLPGIEKPVVTKPEGPIVTGQQITDIEKFYGKGIEDLTDEQVNDYLSKVKTEEIKSVEIKPVEESTIESEIEKYYGKPLDQITDKEMEKFLDLEPIHEAPVPAFKPGPSAEELKHAKTKEGESVINTIKRALKEVETGKPVEIPEEPIKVPEEPTIRPKPEVQTKQITEVDTRTGSPEPEEIVGEESIFNEDPEAMVSRAQLYAKSKSVADSIDQLSDQDPTQPLKDVGTTTWKLINDVNRWKAGASVDIDKVRDFLSELAADADQYRNHFIGGGYPESFFAWKEMVEEAANWARKQVKGKIQPTDEPSLYSGLDPFRAAKVLKDMVKEVRGRATRIKRVNQDQREILADIMTLYNDGRPIEADFTYSKGILWKGLPEPTRKFDLNPQTKDTVKMDFTKMHLKDNEIASGLLDGPFLVTPYESQKKIETVKRFGSYSSVTELIQTYRKALAEIFRVLKPGGLLVVKIQDVGAAGGLGNKPFLASPEIYNIATREIGFSPINRFIYDNPNALARSPGFGSGKSNPRISDSDFWVFRKPARGKYIPAEVREAKLYSGVDPFETIRRVKELFKTNKKPTEIAGSNFANYLKKADEAKEIDVKESLIQGRKGFVKSVIERSGNLRKALLDLPNDKGYEATQLMYLQKGGHPKASRMLDQMIKEVDAGLTANEKKIKHGLILAKRIIDITGYKTEGRQFVTPTGASRSEALIYNTRFGRKSINGLEELTPDRMAKIERAAKTYIDWMKKPVEDAFKEGLITEKERDALISHDYRRIRLIEDIYDKKNEVVLGGHKISVYDSGIERLKRGKKTDIYERNSDVMALEVFNRLYSRIYKNRAGLVALDMARKDKNNPFFRVKESKEDKIPPEFRVNRAFVYENGKRKTLFLSPEVAQEWLTSSAQVTWKYAQAVKWITGAPVVRTFATGINWAFALRNLPKDMTTLWFSARQFENGKWKSVYSPFAPKFLYDIGQDINEVADDVLFRKGQYDDYIDDGGGMDLLTIQGRPLRKGRHIGGPLDKVMDVMAYPGTTSELMTRLAIRRRVIKNRAAERGMTFEEAARDKKIRREATFAARDYLDFSQGGDIAKAADHGFPFLNARIQALRGIIRSFKPGSGTEVASMLKLAQFVGAITALYIGNQKRSPETMKAMQGNRRAKGNLVFPLGDSFGFEDSTGQMRYPFIVVPIDQTMKFFKIFAEGAVDLWLGNPVDTDAIAQSLRDFSPADITTLPPTVSGALGYVQNRDFWLGKDIRKQDELFDYPESAKEFTPGKQSQLLIDIGQQTGLSPERLKYVVEQLITHDNLYAQILGWSYEEMYGKMPKSKRDGYVSEWLSKAPLARSFFALTNPYDQFGKEIDEAKEKSLIDRYIENSGLDVRVNGYLYEKTQTREDVIKYINSFDNMKTVDRLIDRFKFQEDIKNLPNRSFWLRLKGLDDEARAAVYVDRVRKSSDDEIRQLNKELGIVINAGGVVTNGFMEEVMRIQAGKGSSRPLPNIVWPEVQPEKQKSGTLAPGPFEGTRP